MPTCSAGSFATAVRRKSASGDSSWQNNTRYLPPLAALKSNLTLGDFYIPGDLFDSLRVRGVSLASDMKMRPNSQQGFSPVVHGVARTNAPEGNAER